jgi:hypothetical protein
MLEDLTKTLKEQSAKHSKDHKLKEFEKASEEFSKLVKQGIAKRRGYTLLTIDQAHLHRVNFNVKQ